MRGARWLMAALLLAAGGTPAAEPERQLLQVLDEIQARRFEQALDAATALTRDHPKFKLAQLIRGDLLLAMTEPLSGIGSLTPPAKEGIDALAGLRDEARRRWQRHLAPPTEDRLPLPLLQLDPAERHAVVVDLARSRLYLFANQGGEPRLLRDFYVSQGREGAGKEKEGDLRTPVGVYRITSHIPDDKLPDLYGAGAFPVDYPNEWDQRLGKTGHGIWLHGNPSDTYSRPPRASEGCVTLPNADLEAVAPFLEPGRTPVVIADRLEWVPPAELERRRRELLGVIEQWRRDWESRDAERYLRHYSKDFHGDRKDYRAWAAHKRRINPAKRYIKVKLDQISLFRYPGEEMVVADFRQDYRSDNYSGQLRKRQYWRREGDGVWRIVYEG